MHWLKTRTGRVAVGVLVVAIGMVVARVYAGQWAPPRRKYPLQGLEVSQAQGAVDWTTVAANGADFAYIRATDGAATRDAAFEANWAAAGAAGLRVGAVHRWSFCADGVAQANNFVTVVPRGEAALPAVVDFAFDPACAERPDRATLIKQVRAFLRIAETHTGEPMLLKITRSVARDYHLGAALPRPLWEVANFFPPDYGARPWRMWQASDLRRIDGVDGAVDWDVVTP
jgi:lysozyme